MKEKLKNSVIYDDNNDGYATIVELNGEARIRANSDDLINSTVDSLSSDYKGFKSESNITLNKKQDKSDDNLTTKDKSVVGAINEVNLGLEDQKSSIIELQDQVTTNINNIIQNTSDINEIKTDYVKSDDLDNLVNEKQDKTHEDLTTDDKSVVGAINEVNLELEDQKSSIIELQDQVTTNINNIIQNTSDITIIKSDYVKFENLSGFIDGKQDKIDCSLITTNKTVPGAINEIFKIVKGLKNQGINNVNLEAQVEDFDENIVPVQERIKRLKNEIDFLNLQISEKEIEIKKIYEEIKNT